MKQSSYSVFGLALLVVSAISTSAFAGNACEGLFIGKNWAGAATGHISDVVAKTSARMRGKTVDRDADFDNVFKARIVNLLFAFDRGLRVYDRDDKFRYGFSESDQALIKKAIETLPPRYHGSFKPLLADLENPNWTEKPHNVAMFLWLTDSDRLTQIKNKIRAGHLLIEAGIDEASTVNALNNYFETGRLMWNGHAVSLSRLSAGLVNLNELWAHARYPNPGVPAETVAWLKAHPMRDFAKKFVEEPSLDLESTAFLIGTTPTRTRYGHLLGRAQEAVSDVFKTIYLEPNFVEAVKQNLASSSSDVVQNTIQNILIISENVLAKAKKPNAVILRDAMRLVVAKKPTANFPIYIDGYPRSYRTAEQLLASLESQTARP